MCTQGSLICFIWVYVFFWDLCTCVHLVDLFMFFLFNHTTCIKKRKLCWQLSVKLDNRRHMCIFCLMQRSSNSQNSLHAQSGHFVWTWKSNVMCVCDFAECCRQLQWRLIFEACQCLPPERKAKPFHRHQCNTHSHTHALFVQLARRTRIYRWDKWLTGERVTDLKHTG